MADIVSVVQSFGEYLFLGLLLPLLLNVSGLFPQGSGLAALLPASLKLNPQSDDHPPDRVGSTNASHPILSALLLVTVLWGAGVVVNAISYGVLDFACHDRIIAEAYSDDVEGGASMESYQKRTMKDEAIWRAESTETAASMLNRSKLRVARGALVAAVGLVIALFIRMVGVSSLRFSRALAIGACVALVLPLYNGYRNLELEYHLAARHGADNAAKNAQVEAAKSEADVALQKAEAARLTAEAARLSAEAARLTAETKQMDTPYASTESGLLMSSVVY